MKIYCLRIGNKYGPEYEDYINEKLKDYEVVWIRESYEKSIALQWNKMQCMALNTDEPIVVLDIDVLLIGDYKKLFDFPIKRGEFLGIPQWWNHNYPNWKINGGFQKYYPKDCNYIYDIFMKNPKHWMSHYIKSGLTIGPVNGEQFFVEEHVKQNLTLKLVPEKWVTRWTNTESKNDFIANQYKAKFDSNIMTNNQFNDSIKLVHFTTSLNKPHESLFWK